MSSLDLEFFRRPQASPINHQDPMETGDDDETGGDDGPASDTQGPADNLRQQYYEELHPNVPLILGTGPGFVDVFNVDRHAEKRKENLYFPFSSKEEWGLASWLLSSGLSMRAIDDFLALPIVRPYLPAIQPV